MDKTTTLIKPWVMSRPDKGPSETLLMEMPAEELEVYRNHLCISEN